MPLQVPLAFGLGKLSYILGYLFLIYISMLFLLICFSYLRNLFILGALNLWVNLEVVQYINSLREGFNKKKHIFFIIMLWIIVPPPLSTLADFIIIL